MALVFMINRFKALVVILLGVFRRALCCLRRRRRSSCDSIPLSAVGVIPNASNSRAEQDHWEQWDDNPVVVVAADKPVNAIQNKIDQYRQQIAKPSEPVEEPQIDFFEDMTPRITKQKKLLLKSKTEELSVNLSKFAVATERIPTNELEVWDDNTATWEDGTVEEFGDPTEELRRQKRREREKKLYEQQRKRMEYNYRPPPLGEKIIS